MLKTAVTLANTAAVLFTVTLAYAQSSAPTRPGFEIVMPTGSVTTTDPHDRTLERANLTAVQLSYGLRPDLVVTGTVGWAPTRPDGRDRRAALDIFTYDLGAECRVPRRTGDGRFNVKPFTGLGVGARSYNYREAGDATTHTLAAYASAGGEVALAKVRLRLEVRDYFTWVPSSGTSTSTRRNDVVFLAGVRLGIR